MLVERIAFRVFTFAVSAVYLYFALLTGAVLLLAILVESVSRFVRDRQ
jgi:hypothetical protein